MNDVLMAAMQIRIESADRQLKKLVEENAEVRKCLTEFDLRHDADQAEIARLTAALAEAVRAKECFQRMTRAHWEALCAMRNSINEYVPMPNTDSGPLFSPENGPIYADISERVIAALAEAEARGYARGLEDAATKVEANRAHLNFNAMLQLLRDDPLPEPVVVAVSKLLDGIATAIRALAHNGAEE